MSNIESYDYNIFFMADFNNIVSENGSSSKFGMCTVRVVNLSPDMLRTTPHALDFLINMANSSLLPQIKLEGDLNTLILILPELL